MSRARIFDFSKPLENISTLLLDNGVASLAASILEDGHQVDVVDHGNLGLMGYFEPPAALADELRSMEQALTAAPSSAASQAELAGGARRAANEMKAFHRERVDHLAAADAAAVLEDGVDAVLVKAWNGLGMYYFQRLAREVKALAAREHRPVRVLGGGPAVNWLGEHVLRRVEHADAVQFGEGEAAVKLLLRLPATEAGFAQVPGLIFRAGEQIVSNPPQWEPDLDRLALPVYEPSVYRAHQGDLKIKIAMVDDSRGCPNKCFFCAHYHESGEQWRCKSPRRVVDEMEALASKFGIRYFRYAGSSTPPGLRAQIAREILRRDLKVRYCAFINTNTVGEGDMELLKESGCFGVFFGIESINEALARLVHRAPHDARDGYVDCQDYDCSKNAAVTVCGAATTVAA